MAETETHEHAHGDELDLKEIHEDVPPDFYDQGLNPVQKVWHGRRVQEMSKLASNVSGKMLDIGCHGGTLMERVVKQVKPRQAVGIDISVHAIEYAAEKRPRLDLLVGDAESLPFRSATFEAIFASEVMEHIHRPDRLLAEIKRCLADGGYAVVMVPAETPLFKFLWYFWTRFGKGRFWRHAHVQDFGGLELDHVVKDAGFRVLKDKRFMLGMLRALKIAPASAA